MAQTVFWSWQSDRDGRVTRHLIREALVIALDRLHSDTDLEERIDLDHDTRGIPGSPDIVAAILEKIDCATIVVSDVTPIVVSDGGKHVANPNVLIELGYAKKTLSDARVITVWNTAFTASRPEDLPFDLRGRRAPITYSLAEGATPAELRTARGYLAEQFVMAIGACLSAIPPPPTPALDWLPARQDNPAVWFQDGELVRVNLRCGGSVQLQVQEPVRWYARILPHSFNAADLDGGEYAPIVGRWGSFGGGDFRHGAITYPSMPMADGKVSVPSATIWTRRTGEVWIVQAGMSADWRGQHCFYGDEAATQWIEFLARSARHLTQHGGGGPFQARLGLAGLDGLHWPFDNVVGFGSPAALEPDMQVEFSFESAEQESWLPGLLVAWAELRRCFSLRPPSGEEVNKALREHA